MITYLIIFFAVYSFMGWLIEVTYRSFEQKRFVNAGFLFGPFVPIYGEGAVVIILMQMSISDIHIIFQFLFYVIILTALEYLVGELLERIFNLKLWDYSDSKFNINGKISLLFSFSWGALALVLIYIVHPFIEKYVYAINAETNVYISLLFIAYLIIDTGFSVVSIQKVRNNIIILSKNYLTLSNDAINKLIDSMKRTISAFPILNNIISKEIGMNITNKIYSKVKISNLIDQVISHRKPIDEEYNEIISDIICNDRFLELDNYYHHDLSILEHVKIVSYVTYKICKMLKLDYTSGARGALLHDFFLYDWRTHDENWHGLKHPKIALDNSLKEFNLNEIEKDIIIKHMWPLTVIPPRYKESMVVLIVDKYVASREYVKKYSKAVKRKK